MPNPSKLRKSSLTLGITLSIFTACCESSISFEYLRLLPGYSGEHLLSIPIVLIRTLPNLILTIMPNVGIMISILKRQTEA